MLVLERGNMYDVIDYKTLLEKRGYEDALLVDVRTKEEFEEAHIPGAINLELFNYKEREKMGILYKEKRIKEAKHYGIEVATKRLIPFTDAIDQLLETHPKLIFYCARGGYRSSSVTGLYKGLGYPVLKLDGGYKHYRHYVNEMLPELISKRNFITLFGNTGSGKTLILEALKDKGYPVIDLEGLANHRGSILGGVGLGPQPTQKMFEAYLLNALKALPEGDVFIEGESRKIGSVFVPDALMEKMEEGLKVLVKSSLERRVERIRADYTSDDERLIELFNRFRRYLSNEVVDEYINRVREKDYEPVIRSLMVDYYDKNYSTDRRQHDVIIQHEDTEETIEELLDVIKLPNKGK